MEPVKTGVDSFEVQVVEGAPFDMTVGLTLTPPDGGALSSSSATVPVGQTTSGPMTFTSAATRTQALELTLGTPPSLPNQLSFKGLTTAVGGPLVLAPSRGATVATTAVSVPEGGTAAYTIVLNSSPTDPVTITVQRASGDAHDTDLSVSSGATLVFDATNWDQPQTVTIAAAPDADAVNGDATFTHTASSLDSNFGGFPIDSVSATEIDNSTPPTVAITSAATSPVDTAFAVTITFSEDVTGFEVSEITVTNGAASNLQGSGASYTATITPADDGDVTVQVPEQVAQDQATNANEASAAFTINADLTDPTVTVSSSATSLPSPSPPT